MPLFGRGLPSRRDDGRRTRDDERARKIAEGHEMAAREQRRQDDERLRRNREEDERRLLDMHRDGLNDGRY
jgi:hypothetical protein